VVFPNPATDYILTRGYAKVSVIDLNGREIITAIDAEKVDVSKLSKGVYVIKATKNESISVGKLVKN
jgi:hypothetical protein